MKYKIWQIADREYDQQNKCWITVPLIDKIDKTKEMYINPDGIFIVRMQSDEDENWFMTMPQGSEFYELEILEME